MYWTYILLHPSEKMIGGFNRRDPINTVRMKKKLKQMKRKQRGMKRKYMRKKRKRKRKRRKVVKKQRKMPRRKLINKVRI